MKIKFLEDHRGVETKEYHHLAGEVAEIEDGEMARLLIANGRAVELITEEKAAEKAKPARKGNPQPSTPKERGRKNEGKSAGAKERK